jgi:hypothetical protein
VLEIQCFWGFIMVSPAGCPRHFAASD